MTNKFSIQPVPWSYENNLSTKSFQFSIQTTTCLEDMEKPYRQILPILYPDYHMFGGYGKTLSPNPSNSLYPDYHVFGWKRKKLITKSLEGKGKNSSPNPSPILYLDYHIFGGYGKTSSPYPWRVKEKTHHQILPILYLDYHRFGGYGKTLSPNPWREKEKPHHQILPILYLDYHVFGGYGKPYHQILPILYIQTTTCLDGKGKTSSPNPSPILYLDYHRFGGHGKTLSPNPWREKEKHHQILLQFSI